MPELATAPVESTSVTHELTQEPQYDISAMNNEELLSEAQNFNERYKDKSYFPAEEEQEFLKSIAQSIEMGNQGAITYSLRGEKIKPVEARTFLDNVINMEREASDPNYERKTRGTMTDEVAKAALEDFKSYTHEHAIGTKVKRKTAEAIDKAAYLTQRMGMAALRGTVQLVQVGVKGGKAAANVLMQPSTPEPSWIDFVREANAAEQEASQPRHEELYLPAKLSGDSSEIDVPQEKSKQKKARKIGRTALKAVLAAGATYYLKQRNKNKVS
jgi:hypothetical protein